jgi:hypothetical protein
MIFLSSIKYLLRTSKGGFALGGLIGIIGLIAVLRMCAGINPIIPINPRGVCLSGMVGGTSHGVH